MVTFLPDSPPEILYTVPAYSRLRGEAVVHFPLGASQGTVILEREDGGKVYLTEIPAQHLTALASSKSVTFLWRSDEDDLSEPQTVAVRSEAG